VSDETRTAASSDLAPAIAGDAELRAQLERMARQLDEIAAESRRSRERWDAIDELVRDLTPVVALAMDGAATRLRDFETRGYGETLGAGASVLGDVMRSVDRDGIERIGAVVVQLLRTIQSMR
jgi:hypothetical protein